MNTSQKLDVTRSYYDYCVIFISEAICSNALSGFSTAVIGLPMTR